jgi:hypothetical protein
LLSQFPAAIPRGGRAFSSRESLSHRVKKVVLFLMLTANPGTN